MLLFELQDSAPFSPGWVESSPHRCAPQNSHDANLVPLQLALILPSLTAPYVPLLTFGIVSLLGSALALALPETAGHQLPDSFAEVKKLIWMIGRGEW